MKLGHLAPLNTAACDRLENHLFGMFFKNGFRVCLNTDERLMSDTTVTSETLLATELLDLTLNDLEMLYLNAMKSAFAPFNIRLDLIFHRVRLGNGAIRNG